MKLLKIVFLFILVTGITPGLAQTEKGNAASPSNDISSKNFVHSSDNRKYFDQQTNKPETKTFIINTAINDLNEFTKLVKQVSVLKPYGTVQINIATLADKSFYEIPKGGNAWNEYASNNAPLYKFFPDAKIAPFLPAEFLKKNRQLLLDKAKILRENGMDAAFFSNEPAFLPSEFFDAYPEMRGPRIDHPRRSNVPFFSPCVCVKETQEMYVNMIADLLKAIPEIKTFYFKTNDAGGGFCWSSWLYSGPNGPSNCKHYSTGERVNMLMTALQNGASKSGRRITVYLTGNEGTNFSETEKKDIHNNLPADCYFIGDNSAGITSMWPFLGTSYPVKGILDPLSFLQSIKSMNEKSAQTIFIGFKAAYSRANESADATYILLEILAEQLKQGAETATWEARQLLMKYCEEWAGKKSAEKLFNAFVKIEETQKYKGDQLPNVNGIYWGVSNRMISRPLLIAPQRLSEKEEAYFLPYVFNVSKEEARMDFTDIGGFHTTASDSVVENYVSKIREICVCLDSIDASAPKKELIRNVTTALRIYASVIRSCGNFAEAQEIRDRNAAKLNAPIHRPNKEITWAGDSDFLKFNNIMRDELDNTQELIELLQNGGMNLLCHANDAMHEDTFLLGPDLIDQLKKKRKIMLDHWRDIEDYLTSPFK